VVAGHDEDGDAALRQRGECGVCAVHDRPRYAAVREEVAAVDDQVRARPRGVVKHALVVVEEVGAVPPSAHSRLHGIVEAEVGVGEQQDGQFAYR
jgi:hypothetical protein